MASMEIKPVQLCLYLFRVHFPTKSNFVSICSMLNLLAPVYPSHFPAAAAAATTTTTTMVTAAVATTTTVMAAAGTVDADDRNGHGRQRQWARAWSTTDTGTVDDDGHGHGRRRWTRARSTTTMGTGMIDDGHWHGRRR